MQQEFWLQRWQNGETGFHQENLNPYLGYFYGEKGPALEERLARKVFVPLCGKSQDMQWLAKNGYEVLAIECSEIAVNDFFKQHALDYQVIEARSFSRYVAEAGAQGQRRIEILLGDFFELTPSDLLGVTDTFDRASMIALPEDMRLGYCKKMTELQTSGMRTLLVTLTYPQKEMNGPPFSVTEQEIIDFYGESYQIDKLMVKNILADEPRFQQRGVSELLETVYRLTRN